MFTLPQHGAVKRFFLAADSLVSTSLYEFGDLLSRFWSAYASFLQRFRVFGVTRLVVDLIDDGATFALFFAIGIVSYALPPFSGTGDIWNRGRQYAVTFTDTNGEVIGRRGVRQDDNIPLEEIPPHVVYAVLATEDSRFFDHFGIDPIGTARAMVENAKAKNVVQGGSTLTMQLAKNLFLSPDRTLRRKINEVFLSLWIEARLSKDEILKMYLDRAYMGGGTYGVEAAAQYYFGKSIRDVTLQEAAILAGLFKAPSKYAPHANIENARARANVVLTRMLDEGYISQGELFDAQRHPADVVLQADGASPDYFLDLAYKETLQILERQGHAGDYVIEVKTTIDRPLQTATQQIVNHILETEAPKYKATQAAVVTMTPEGAVRAIVGGRNYEDSQFNRATDALRSPGSAFKPFVYLAALKAGFKPETMVVDTPITINGWSPRNYSNKYTGSTPLWRALAKSYNTVPVILMTKIGRKAIIDTAREVGIQSPLLSVPSLPLGVNEMTVLDITRGYATFANGGRLSEPHTVLEIRRPNGEVVYTRALHQEKQVVPEETIADLNFMMNRVVTDGTGRRAFLGYTPQAGKTGTTSDYRDAWFVGYTAQLSTGVWFGNDDYSEMEDATGGTLPAMTWKLIMDQGIHDKTPLALAGVPLNEGYFKVAAEYRAKEPADATKPDAGFDLAALDSLTVGLPSAPRAVDEDAAAGPRPQKREKKKSDGVVRVLSDMFGLFKKEEQPRPVAVRQQRSGDPFQNFFGRNQRQQQKVQRNQRKIRSFFTR